MSNGLILMLASANVNFLGYQISQAFVLIFPRTQTVSNVLPFLKHSLALQKNSEVQFENKS